MNKTKSQREVSATRLLLWRIQAVVLLPVAVILMIIATLAEYLSNAFLAYRKWFFRVGRRSMAKKSGANSEPSEKKESKTALTGNLA